MTKISMHFVSSTDAPISEAPVTIYLSHYALNTLSNDAIMSRREEFTTDSEGNLLVDLLACDRLYHVTVYDTQQETSIHHDFYVPPTNDPDTVYNLTDLIVRSGTALSSLPYDEVALIKIIAAKLEAQTAAATSVDAKNIALSATASAEASKNAAQVSAIAAADSAESVLNIGLDLQGVPTRLTVGAAIADQVSEWSDVPEILTTNASISGLAGPMNAQAVAITKRLNMIRTRYVDAISALDTSGLPDGITINAKGRDTIGDGGGGIFRFVAGSVQAADGGTVFAPQGGGRVFRDGWTVLGYNGPVSVAWFGVVGHGWADDTVAMSLALTMQEATRCLLTVPSSFRVRISAPLDMAPTLRIRGEGAAVQLAPTFVAVGGTSIFKARVGFASESCAFENLCFDSETPGTGIAFYGTTTDYISQATWRNCVWKSNLLYGINCPIILNSFYDCDFGSYPGAVQNFTAIQSIGTDGIEANANCFFKCVFRKSGAASMIDTRSTGVQWNFYACDFEQNHCRDMIIRFDGGGSINFYGGYVETNDTPYFLRVYGSLAITFCQVIKFHGVHVKDPATIAILKREIAYPFFDIQGCYGALNCNVTQNENGEFNKGFDLEACYGNYFLAGSGSYGELATVNNPAGYNARRVKAIVVEADKGTIPQLNSVQKLGVSVTAPNTTVCTLSSSLTSGIAFSGLVSVAALSGSALVNVNVNAASYLLNVSNGGISSCTLVSASGVTAGGAANHPSFTWSLGAAGELQATPVGATSGDFSFMISCTGMIKAM